MIKVEVSREKGLKVEKSGEGDIMRTKKYKKIVEDNGYRYYENNYSITARKYSEENYDIEIKVGKLRPGRLEVNIKGFCGDESDIILKAMELAETPLEDREVDMKSFLVHKFMRGGNNLAYPGYLMQCYDVDLMYLGNDVVDGHSFSNDRKTFTTEEIEKIKKENNTKLKDFYIIPDTDKNRRILFSINCEADFNIEDFELIEVEE